MFVNDGQGCRSVIDADRLDEQRNAIIFVQQIPIVVRRLLRIVEQRRQLRLACERRQRITIPYVGRDEVAVARDGVLVVEIVALRLRFVVRVGL